MSENSSALRDCELKIGQKSKNNSGIGDIYMKNVLIITGAVSGFGREFLNQMLEKGDNIDEIWAIDRKQEQLDQMHAENERIIGVCMDLIDWDCYAKLENKLAEEKPNVAGLFNCAGFGIFDHTENLKFTTEMKMVDLNVKAYLLMIRLTLPYMSEGSKILNIASCAGFQPLPYINCYGATKAFVLSYSRALNRELRYRKIHVLTVTPFWTKTGFFKHAVIEGRKPVVIKYAAMYEPKDVVAKAIKDLYRGKDVSVYGFVNKFQHMLTKLLPHSLIMKIWMNQQKYDGTPEIR